MNPRAKSVFAKISNNWGLKLMALLLATMSFYGVRWATRNQKDFTVPVVVDVEDGIAVLAQTVNAVTVTARGTLDDMLKIDPLKMRAHVSSREGEPDGLPRLVAIQRRNIEGAPNVSIVKIDPPELLVTFDREVETTFSVARPVTDGRPLVGRVEVEYSPMTVSVAGPKRRLEELKRRGLDSLQTEEVSVDGRTESFSRRVAILPPEGLVLKIEPAEVEAKISIIRDIATLRLERIPVMIMGDEAIPDQWGIEPAEVVVTLEGSPSVVNSLTNNDVRVFVDCAGMSFDERRSIDLRVYIPVQEGVSYSVEPESVSIGPLPTRETEDSP